MLMKTDENVRNLSHAYVRTGTVRHVNKTYRTVPHNTYPVRYPVEQKESGAKNTDARGAFKYSVKV